MTFISIELVRQSLREHGMVTTLQLHSRKRIAPGFTVADYVRIGEFFSNAHHPKQGDLEYWDSICHPKKSAAVA